MRPLLLLALCMFALTPLPLWADDQGQTQFVDHCAACHGLHALGGNGPDIQGATLNDVVISTRGMDQMPEIDLSEAEQQAIATYLMSLAPEIAAQKLRFEAQITR
jgi:mono/diheme cytochrome c family protein